MKMLKELGVSPAPWAVNKYDDVTTANGNMVACVEDWDVCDTAEMAANAHLIAAAPDLYEALREVYERIADIQDEHSLSHADGEPVCDECYNAVAWVSKARAALEKAGGAR